MLATELREVQVHLCVCEGQHAGSQWQCCSNRVQQLVQCHNCGCKKHQFSPTVVTGAAECCGLVRDLCTVYCLVLVVQHVLS